MSFGKKPPSAPQPSVAPVPPPPPPAGDPHNRRKVFPDEVWQGKSGAMLRELGFSPNDESNLVPNGSSINAKLVEGKSRIDARHAQAQANAQSLLRDAQLRPFYLIPDPIWNSDAGTFLMTSLDLYPYDDWNVVFLAADQRTALVMDIALHPNGNVPAFVTAAEKFMADARAHMKRATEEAELTSNYAAFGDTREDVQLRVKGLAMSFARSLIEAWEKQKSPDLEPQAAFARPPHPQRRNENEESTGVQAIAEELGEEAQQQAKSAAVSFARSVFSAWNKGD